MWKSVTRCATTEPDTCRCSLGWRQASLAAARVSRYASRMHSVHVYQILNHYTSRQELDPGFEVLDNSANERPDWYEYWPIRRYLLNEPLDEGAFYGFLSPKFRHKTNLSAAAVHEFVARETGATDVVLLSPSIHLTAYHLNVFEYGDEVHPGLLQ